MCAAAHVAEAAAGASHTTESAQGRYIVDPVRFGEIDALVRIVQIRADLKSQTFPNREGLGERSLRPHQSRRFQRVATECSWGKRRWIAEPCRVEIGVLGAGGEPVGPDRPALRHGLIVGQDLVRPQLPGQPHVRLAWRERRGRRAGSVWFAST